MVHDSIKPSLLPIVQAPFIARECGEVLSGVAHVDLDLLRREERNGSHSIPYTGFRGLGFRGSGFNEGLGTMPSPRATLERTPSHEKPPRRILSIDTK